MTKRQELLCASLLLAFVGFCGFLHFKGRKAMARKIALEKLETEFFTSMGEIEEGHGMAKKNTEEAFAYAEG